MPANQPLRIGVLAPPWVPVPPKSYGGTELVLDVLCRGLRDRGHEVLLFTTGDSTCPVPKDSLFAASDPDRMGTTVLELRHVAAAYDVFARCDLVHDHTLAGPFLAQFHPDVPVVTTVHGPFEEDLRDLYRRVGADIPLIAISHDQAGRAPAGVAIAAVIHHGLDLDRYRFDALGGDYLVTLGRMSPDKGIHIAIEVARRSGKDLAIAAKMREPGERQFFDEVIRPRLGHGVDYVGELGHAAKIDLLGRASALLNPIQWDEPFGLVMAEALACGTPVIGTPRGAAPEIVDDGTTGFLGTTVDELADAVSRVGRIDRRLCRDRVVQRFSMARLARDHEIFYRSVLAETAGPAGRAEPPARDPRDVPGSPRGTIDLRDRRPTNDRAPM